MIPLAPALVKEVEQPKVNPLKDPKAECEARGWIWDAATNFCNNPNVRPLEKEETLQEQNKNIIFNKDKTVSIERGGVTEQFTQEEYKDLLEVQKGRARSADPKIQQAALTDQEVTTQQQAATMQEALAGLGLTQEEINQIQNTPLAQANIDWGQALTAGASKVVPYAIGGAASLGSIGAAVTAPAGGVGGILTGAIGGIGGAISGLFVGMQSNIKTQQSGEIGAANQVLTNAKTNMQKASLLAIDPTKLDFAIKSFEFWEAEAYKARNQLKAETQGNLNKFMDDGREDLAAFDLFLDDRFGLKETYKQRIIKAANQELTTEQLYALMSEEQ